MPVGWVLVVANRFHEKWQSIRARIHLYCITSPVIDGCWCWFWGMLISIDQLANALFWPVLNAGVQRGGAKFGSPDETLSSVMGKNIEQGTCRFCVWVCYCLHWLDRDHCHRSIEDDEPTRIKGARD